MADLDQVIANLPEANREAVTGLITSIREGLEGDIQTLKGDHGKVLETLQDSNKAFEIQIAALNAGSGSGGGTNNGSGIETVDQVRARHQKENDEKARTAKDAETDTIIKGYRDREFAAKKETAKAAGISDEVLALVTTPETLALMLAMNANGNGSGIKGDNGGTGGSKVGTGGGNTGDTTPPLGKMDTGLKVLADAGNPFGEQ